MDTRIKYLEEEREVLKKKVSTLEDDVMGKSSQLEKRTLTEHEEKQKVWKYMYIVNMYNVI